MPLSNLTRITLLDAARHSIRQSLDDQPVAFNHRNGDPVLHAVRASFVTLKRRGALRGCIGNLDAKQELLADVMQNAKLAAYRDPRFPPLLAAEFEDLHIEISVLSASEPVAARSRNELLQALRPGTDGVTVQEGEHRATFLPAVWANLPDPSEFFEQLMCKAGLSAVHWSPALRFFRYQAESFGEGEQI